MKHHLASRLALLVSLALALLPGAGGCSYVLTRNPSRAMLTEDQTNCTSHHGYTIVDAVIGAAAVGVGATVIILEQKDEPDYQSVPTYVIGIPLLALGAAFLASSSHGHGKVTRCRKALARHDSYEP
ncbi:MAG: hypothetical protein M3680_24960 [Myxococcota bacterium]|nr:hypothetical protein [Myxococcota bacterium]